MADGRILHRRGSFGDRIVRLDHLPFRVWCQYVLSADDYGVMRASASVVRADNPRLEQEPLRAIVRAMVTIEQSGLVQTFAHQSVTYWWQTDWQDFQGIRYPRDSVNPKPAPEVIATATPKTQRLFAVRSVSTPQDFGNGSEIDPHPAGAGGRQTLPLTQTPTLTPTPSEDGDYSFALDGGGVWRLPHAQIEKWERQYRGVPVRDELHRAEAWLEANKPKRKTPAGMPKFLAAWLGRCDRKPEPKQRVDWFAECSAVHDGGCENQNEHHLRMEGALAERKRA